MAAAPPRVVPSGVEVVAAVTGEDSPNRTGSRFGFLATDLGILWDDGAGAVLAAFGDTYGEGWRGPGAGARTADHRRNVLARCGSAPDRSAGLTLDEVIEDGPGHAAEILPADPRLCSRLTRRRGWMSALRLVALRPVRVALFIESTVIPTAGIAVDGVQYLHYMSVRRWGRPGRWRTNYGGIARSTDGGRTWTKDPGARWRNTPFGRHPFQMGAFARDDRWVYLFGTRNGRYGPVYLARVAPAGVGDPAHYEYWTGGGGWAHHPWRARPAVSGPAGELSVAYHSGLGVWLMVHLHDPGARLLLRAARDVTGPWSDGEPLLTAVEHPALYGGYLHPGALDSDHIYFTFSRWGPYNVYLARADVAVG